MKKYLRIISKNKKGDNIYLVRSIDISERFPDTFLFNNMFLFLKTVCVKTAVNLKGGI